MENPNDSNNFFTSNDGEEILSSFEKDLLRCRSENDPPVNFLTIDDHARATAEIMFPDIDLFEKMTLLDASRHVGMEPAPPPDNEKCIMGEDCMTVEHEGVRVFYNTSCRFVGFTARTPHELLVWHAAPGEAEVELKFAWKALSASVAMMSRRMGDVFEIEAEQTNPEDGVVFTISAFTLPVWSSSVDGFLSYNDEVEACTDIINKINESLEGLFIPSSILDRLGMDSTGLERWSDREHAMFALYCIGALSFSQKFKGEDFVSWSVSVRGLELSAHGEEVAHVYIRLPHDEDGVNETTVENMVHNAFVCLLGQVNDMLGTVEEDIEYDPDEDPDDDMF